MTTQATNTDLSTLINIASTYLNSDQVEQIQRAYHFASNAHEGQMRKSGEAFITHPLMVATILANLKQDTSTICAGLLHDTIEDTDVKKSDMQNEFGEDITHLVLGVTKLGTLEFHSKEERQAENFRNMFLAMAKDIRVVVIKLSDRLHNMQTLRSLPEKKQYRIARETREIFSPLAHRLGMWSLKWELEDLAFSILQPNDFQHIKSLVASRRNEREHYVAIFCTHVEKMLQSNAINATVTGRPKHFYSIYRKLQKKDISFDELYDMLGIRVIVTSVPECYQVLGVLHSEYKPIAGRIKDYIAVPKSNLYQSLHTTVIGPEGKPVEIQIRTDTMHQIAEFGVAAHWQYKEGKVSENAKQDFSWLRELVNIQSDTLTPKDYLNELKLDLFIDEVFVYTPKGDIQVLRKGATPLDFAYKIHTEVGHCTKGAKVNGKIVPLHYVLQNGDRINILTGKDEKPTIDWLSFVKTSQARNKIKQWLRRQKTIENISIGKDRLYKTLLVKGFSPKTILSAAFLPQLQQRFTALQSIDELYLHIAQGEISPHEVITHLRSLDTTSSHTSSKINETSTRPTPKQFRQTIHDGLRVVGEDNISIRIAQCCDPVPGDDVIGFITMGAGVSVHRTQCQHILTLADTKRDRLIDVSWNLADSQRHYPVTISIEGFDRDGVLSDLLQRITDQHAHINQVHTHIKDSGTLVVTISIDIIDLNQLKRIISAIQRSNDVLQVRRLK